MNASYEYIHDPRTDNQSAIKTASKLGNINAVKCLLNVPFVDPSVDVSQALRKASYNRFAAIVRELLKDKRVDQTVLRNFCFSVAAEPGFVGVVLTLINDERVGVTKGGMSSPFFYTCPEGHAELVKILLAHPKLDLSGLESGNLGFMKALLYGHLEVIQLLMVKLSRFS
jgi:hypothetical protein